MGKKSKRGATKAGKTSRPAAGQGKSGRSKSVGSVGGGGSIASSSRDDYCSGLSVDGTTEPMQKTMNVQPLLPPRNVDITLPMKESAPTLVSPDSSCSDTDENKPVPRRGVPAAADMIERPAVAAVASTQPVVEEPPSDNTLWSTKLRDVVSDETSEEMAAVLDVTMDLDDGEDAAPVASSSRDMAVLDSRQGILDLNQAMPKEAESKHQECCIIL
jgi:hypothetical protein